MPKEVRTTTTYRQSPFPVGHSRVSKSAEPQAGPRNTANWNAADDEILLAARAAGLNWQATATKHFPNKSANACRKRHERLVERRTHEDWNSERLDTLASEYMELRKEIWAPLAAKLGERWSVVEAKCMEKGLKNLQSIARAARRTSGPSEGQQGRGNQEEHEGDSGIGCSDAEMEPAENTLTAPPDLGPLEATQGVPMMHHMQQDRAAQEAPAPAPAPAPAVALPLYQPPPPALTRAVPGVIWTPIEASHGGSFTQRATTPENTGQRGISIKSMLSHTPRSEG